MADDFFVIIPMVCAWRHSTMGFKKEATFVAFVHSSRLPKHTNGNVDDDLDHDDYHDDDLAISLLAIISVMLVNASFG